MNPAVPASVQDITITGMIMQADPVVKGVLVLLVLASIACWAVIIEKSIALAKLRRQARLVAAAATTSGSAVPQPGKEPGLAADILRAGVREWHDGREPEESRTEFRARIERAMRAHLSTSIRRLEPGLPLLATTGAVAPFVGLFGTVYGIMNSFTGIAASGDTSLAVVAPGIAEALFATAIGLVAAIPAVIAYNRLSLSLGRIRAEASAAIAELGGRLCRRSARDAGLAAAAE